ncbi:MAG TPA: SUMF1/EgtB/PvdO family nonheme iron enzyme, partial [Spirochaetota bacterium]|nr:SUMF1/EgtB/PvdO family nonheme iron enzyme [Spirochaetota bacterium]
GYTITPALKTVVVYKAPVAVSFSGLSANGTSGSVTTTELTLTLDVEPVGLDIDDITVTGATKGALSGTGTTRTLTISGITVGNGGTVTVALANPAGYTITPALKTVVVYKAPVAVSFSGLSANGTSGSVTTTELTLTFDVEPVGLDIDDITVTGATKGTLSGTGTTRTLTISGVTVGNGGTVTVALANPVGYTITPALKTVVVYKAPVAVSFSGLSANGTSGSVTTTELTLTFDVELVGLDSDDITVTGATKGALSGTGTTRTLTISAITVGNGGEVTVALANPAGYAITPAFRTVVVYVDVLSSVSYRETVSVPGGTFTQVPTSGNTFSHTITGFRMGKYEVTYELWYTVYQWALGQGYFFANAGREGHNGTIGAAPTARKYEPVTHINWRDAIVWCNAYSQMSGLTPVYCSDSGLTTPIKDSRDGSYGSSVNTTAGSFDKPYVNWNATGYRLPTEGEWQYAASYKDGSSWTAYNYASGATAVYTDTTATGLVAWYSGNAGSTTKTVGTKGANALGIHDMSGNVWEWCWDWWGTLPTTAQNNYRGPASGSGRIERGGCYDISADYLQVGSRIGNYPYFEYSHIGFRLASKQ